MTVGPENLRSVLRRWASGVTVVTSCDGEQLHGMTVSSFASISLAPPLVLVSLEQSTRTHSLVSKSSVFAVSILAQDQAEISDLFAGRVPDEADRVAEIAHWQAPSGSPIVEGCLAYLDCEVVAAHDAGTHSIFVGQVSTARVERDDLPLLYHNRMYHRLPP